MNIFWRSLVLFLFANNSIFSSAQVIGLVKDFKGIPIQFASIKIKNSFLGTESDSLGIFKINAFKGDTLLIYHLNFGHKELSIDSQYIEVIMEKTKHKLQEVEVSGSYAFRLFDTCKINTYNMLRQSYLSRSYWRGIDICGSDTLCLVDIDFDIEQKSLNKLGREAILRCSKVQEKVVVDSSLSDKGYQLNFQVRVKPFENNFLIYEDFKDEYVCLIKDDSIFIKLLFIPKKEIKKGYNNIEVSIWKDKLFINYIASCTAKSKQKYAGERKSSGRKIKNREVAIYAKYELDNEMCYLASYEMYKLFDFTTKDGNILSRKHISKYQVYNTGGNDLHLRKGKMIYEFNILERANNNYVNSFWKHSFQDGYELYDFESLRVANEY
ncbi:MAG: hypothetical protein JEZ14_17680 [Marinilabiliaceae bacterium]|nr:hypothetical protein [Marinilabiliaceae bacterium]